MNIHERRLETLLHLEAHLRACILHGEQCFLGPNDALLIAEFIRHHNKVVRQRSMRRKVRILNGAKG